MCVWPCVEQAGHKEQQEREGRERERGREREWRQQNLCQKLSEKKRERKNCAKNEKVFVHVGVSNFFD